MPTITNHDDKHERHRNYMRAWRAAQRQTSGVSAYKANLVANGKPRTAAKPDLSKFDEWCRAHGRHRFSYGRSVNQEPKA